MKLDDDSSKKEGRRTSKSRSPKRKLKSDDKAAEKHNEEKDKSLQAKEDKRQEEEVERERLKLAEEAKRMDRTVMLIGLSVRADERVALEPHGGYAQTCHSRELGAKKVLGKVAVDAAVWVELTGDTRVGVHPAAV